MYFPTPAQAVATMAASFTPIGERSYLDLATVASSAANKLEVLAKDATGEYKQKLLKAVKDRRKRSNYYIEMYMAGEVWNPKPSF